jgi:hypothetical protein
MMPKHYRKQKASHGYGLKYHKFDNDCNTSLGGQFVSDMEEVRDKVVSGVKTVAHNLKTFAQKAEERVYKFFKEPKNHNLWMYRTHRLLTPQFFAHINSCITLVCVITQIYLLLQFIKSSDGHLGNVKNIAFVMFPAYLGLGVNCMMQILAFFLVLKRALYYETTGSIHREIPELNRFLPVLEHLLVVLAYGLFCVTAYAIGSCHLNYSKRGESSLCESFNIHMVTVILSTTMAFKIIHHLVAIYNHHRHSSCPRPDRVLQQDTESRGGDSVVQKMINMDHEIYAGWTFWEIRMKRIMSASLAENLCKIWGISWLGVFLILLVTQIHKGHGNMGNIPDSFLVFPLYTMFFGKAVVQLGVIVYVHFNHFGKEHIWKGHPSHPSQAIKTLEHCLPIFTNIFFGVLTIAIGECHLNPLNNNGQMMCQIFSYAIVKGVIAVVGVIQMIHHTIAIMNSVSNCSKLEKREGQEKKGQLEMTVSYRNNAYLEDQRMNTDS